MINNPIDLNYVPAAGSIPQSGSVEPTRTVDDRVWKTRLDQEHRVYSAQVRILPNMKRDAQGNMDYDRANPSPFRKIMVHYLRIGNGEKKFFKCLKTTHEGLRQKGICPFCDWTFNRYAMLKKAAETGDAVAAEEMRNNQRNQASTSYVVNALVREDTVHPEFNNKVKIWEHSVKVNEILDYPREPEVVAKRRWRSIKENRYKNDSEFVPDAFEMKNASRFYPEQLIQGRDFIVTCQESGKEIDGKKINGYDSSKFVDSPSDLASSTDEVMSYLSQCVDLDEYQKEGLAPNYQEAQKMLTEWLASQPEGSDLGANDNVAPNSFVPAAKANPKLAHMSGANFIGSTNQTQLVGCVQPPSVGTAIPAAQPVANTAPVQPPLSAASPRPASPVSTQMGQQTTDTFAQHSYATQQPPVASPVQSAMVQPKMVQPVQPQPVRPVQPAAPVPNTVGFSEDDLPF